MTTYGQPVISRETRRLLVTLVVSVTALMVLARIRFQERPVSAPVPNMLAQLRSVSSYDDLARAIADMRPGIMAAVSAAEGRGLALRIREDAAITLAPGPADTVLASDRATGLALVSHPPGDVPGLLPWVPRLLDYPRYLVAADTAGDSLALRPVFVGGLTPSVSPLWSGDLWALPPATPISPGTFVFTTDGAFAGMCIAHSRGVALVPAAVLFAAANLLQPEGGEPGDLGVAVQPLTPAIAAATGARTGVVITAIDPASPAHRALVATEVIEAVDGQDVRAPEDWRARADRVHVNDSLTLRVRGSEGVRELTLTAMPLAAAGSAADAPLGLTLRSIPKLGAEVVSVEPRSPAARARIRERDLITVAGGVTSPTSAHIARAFASLPPGGVLVAAVTRGEEHRVVAIEK